MREGPEAHCHPGSLMEASLATIIQYPLMRLGPPAHHPVSIARTGTWVGTLGGILSTKAACPPAGPVVVCGRCVQPVALLAASLLCVVASGGLGWARWGLPPMAAPGEAHRLELALDPHCVIRLLLANTWNLS